jgi:hypothetical protein
MDTVAGAAILAERFSKLTRTAATPRAATVDPNALPVFQWVGLEPPDAAAAPATVAARARVLQLRLLGFAAGGPGGALRHDARDEPGRRAVQRLNIPTL